MIVALSHAPSMKQMRIISERHGFMTFPQFLDNNFVNKNKADVKYLEKNLGRYGMGRVQFAVAPDYMLDEALRLKEEYPDVNWIWPLHSKEEDVSEFEWVAYLHDKPRREDYGLQTYFKLTENKKKWYLGYWESVDPNILFRFDGFDTTIPMKYAGQYGKVWYSWQKSERVSKMEIDTEELFEFNVISLKIALRKLMMRRKKQIPLTEILVVDEQ